MEIPKEDLTCIVDAHCALLPRASWHSGFVLIPLQVHTDACRCI